VFSGSLIYTLPIGKDRRLGGWDLGVLGIVRLSRSRSDFDRTRVFSGSLIYTLPFGRNRRLGGWDLGVLGIWESGPAFSVSSGRQTAGDLNAFAHYAGDRNIGRLDRRGDSVYWFSREDIPRFSFPAAGEFGSSGRNTFRGPRFFNIDLSV